MRPGVLEAVAAVRVGLVAARNRTQVGLLPAVAPRVDFQVFGPGKGFVAKAALVRFFVRVRPDVH